MPKSLNSCQFIGHVGRKPELKSTANGRLWTSFSIATNESFKPAGSDEWQERTEWINLIAWEHHAEVAEKYLDKGKQVYVEGRMQTREWEKDGKTGKTTEIVVRDLILLGGRGEGGGHRPPDPTDNDAPVYTSKPVTSKEQVAQDISAASVATQFGGQTMPPDDNIPF